MIVESDLKSNLGDRLSRLFQQVSRYENAESSDVFSWTDTESMLEKPLELSLGETASRA